MKDLPEYELLSAYLDGELTADERAQVEQLLAGSPAARQLLDEMRTLSGTLQTLPVHRLEENLSQRVLRMAERRMLSESPAPSAVAMQPETDAGPSIGRQLSRPRTWLWPAVAVAAALVMWFRVSEVAEPVAERQLAMAPKAAAPAEPPSIQAPPALADKVAAPAMEAAEAESVAPAMPGTPAERPSVDALAADAPAEESVRREVPKQALKTAEKKEEAGTGVPTYKSAPPATTAPRPPAASQPTSQPTPIDLASEAPSPARHPAKGAPLALKAKASETANAGEAPLLIVQCEITGEAAKQQVFREILTAEQFGQFDGTRLHKNMANLKQDFSQGQPGEMMGAPDDSSVEFSATRGEVLALLAKLKARPDLVVSVPEPAQLGLLVADMKSAPQTSGLAGGKERAELGQQRQRSTETLPKPAYSLKGQEEGQHPNEANSGPSQGMSQRQTLAQDRMQTAQQSMQGQVDSDEPTYRVRVELRVVADSTIVGGQTKPAKPAASAPQLNTAPATAPAKGKP